MGTVTSDFPAGGLTVVAVGGDRVRHLATMGCGGTWSTVPERHLLDETRPIAADILVCATVEICANLRASNRWDATGVIVVGAPSVALETDALAAGADDFIALPVAPAIMCARVQALGRRVRRAFAAVLHARVDDAAAAAGLSPREREVLDLLLLGRNTVEIGAALAVTPRTAKFHQANVLTKLGADSRHDLLRLLM